MRTFFLLSALLCACAGEPTGLVDPSDTDLPDGDTDVDTDSDTGLIQDGVYGFIGSPCGDDSDCPYDGGVCVTDEEGYPRGMCSLACDSGCPDADGHPTTFCVDAAVPRLGGDGACHARCDFGAFPGNGCRTGYGCVVEDRPNSSKQTWACLPGEQTELTACAAELTERGIAFERDVVAPESPADHPNLTCSIEDPVRILGEMHGVELVYANGTPTPRVLGACNMALALSDTIQDVEPDGVTELIHYGTYNCRVIGGTDRLSRHAFGDAIDIYGFTFDDGTTWTLIDDWEHDTPTPRDEGARWLYDSAYRWYDDRVWNIILTPNYNQAHDDHFHVDLTPGGDYIGATDGRFIGPAPYAD